MKLSTSPQILIVPDSFKGTLEAPLVARSIASGFEQVFPSASINCFPMADGGEGSSTIVGELLDAKRIALSAIGPEGRPVEAFYYFLSDSKRAFIELAAASGLPLSREPKTTGIRATTFGTGQLIRDAIARGAREITLFLGGSATTDGGVGMAKAIGYQFFNRAGELMEDASSYALRSEEFPGERLDQIGTIAVGGAAETLEGVSVTAVVDVPNPLFGPKGAAHVYGPQKGLNPEMVASADGGLENLAKIAKRDLGKDFALTPGAGAAGGAGFGVLTFFSGALSPGAPYFLDLINFNERASGADLIITGEGKVDIQSAEGKLLCELLKRTSQLRKPLLSLSGVVDLAQEHFARNPHFTAFGLGRPDAVSDTAGALARTAFQVARLLT